MTFKTPFTPLTPLSWPPPAEGQRGPWMIYSMHWNSWHRRSKDGGAAGYTDDIAQAGLFDFERAKAYDDRLCAVDPGRRPKDVAFEAIHARPQLIDALNKAQARADDIRDMITRVAGKTPEPR